MQRQIDFNCPECGTEVSVKITTKRKKPEITESEVDEYELRPRNVFDWPEFRGRPSEARKYIAEHGTLL